MNKLNKEELGILWMLFRNYSINELAAETEIKPDTLIAAAKGEALIERDHRDIKEMLCEYSQE